MNDTQSTTKIILYSFTAGYMVSQFNILGFAAGCGFMMALNFIPEDIKNFNVGVFNTVLALINNKVNQYSKSDTDADAH